MSVIGRCEGLVFTVHFTIVLHHKFPLNLLTLYELLTYETITDIYTHLRLFSLFKDIHKKSHAHHSKKNGGTVFPIHSHEVRHLSTAADGLSFYSSVLLLCYH